MIPSGRFRVVTAWTATSRAGSIRERVPAISLLTQTASGVTAMLFGPSPTGIVARMLLLAGSMRVTVPSRLFATQTPFAPTVTASAPLPVCLLATMPLDRASILVTLPAASLVTQTEP